MVKSTAILAGAGLGAGLMYLLDPDAGRRRRALTRDRLIRATHVAGHAAGAAGRDLAHRASGAVARIRGRAKKHERVDDTVLVERVRARLGHLVSHPGALEVHASEGVVTLTGPVLRDEVSRLLRGIGQVNGVQDVIDRLDVHDEPGNVPALQGGRVTRERPLLSPSSPAMRAIAGTAGAAAAAYGAAHGRTSGLLTAAAGLGLIARAVRPATGRRGGEPQPMSGAPAPAP
ncbi:MAG TPA: BON domain-containing protein [Vicinamibacterales bacterium]